MVTQCDSDGVVWEEVRGAYRGHIVPRRAEVKRRGTTRGKRAAQARERKTRREAERQAREQREQDDQASQSDNESGADQDAATAEQQATWGILSPEEMVAAVALIGPKPWYTLTFDTETVVPGAKTATQPGISDVLRCGQPLRVGYYELHGISEWEVARRLRRGGLTPDDRHRLREAGFILPDPQERIALADGTLTPIYAGYEDVLAADRAVVEEYVGTHAYRGEVRHLHIRSKQEFVRQVLYRYAYGYAHIIGARLLGHNVLFDLARHITDVHAADGTLIRGVRRGAGWARRGFSLKLCDCPYEDCYDHPRIRVVKLGRMKLHYAFTRNSVPSRGSANGNRRKREYRGRFLDTITLGLALRKGKSASLAAMGQSYGARVLKQEHPNFSGPLTEEYLDYLVGDVRATYWLGVAELEQYHTLGLDRKPESIFSSASLAKAYLQQMRFPRAAERRWQLNVPSLGYSADDVQGFAATAFYGGRSECHWRLDPVEVLHLDFKSCYVAVCDLLGLQRFWLARQVTVRDATADVRAWLQSMMPAELLAALQRPETWQRWLCTYVKWAPDGRLTLPWRGDHQQSGPHPKDAPRQINISQSYVRRDAPRWDTLLDVAAGIIRQAEPGIVPDIEQVIEIVARDEQVEIAPMEIAGHSVDPSSKPSGLSETVWTRFIDVRRAVKAAGKVAGKRGEASEAARLDGQEKALKEAALSGSYGILEELNEKVYEGRLLTLDVYAHGRTTRLGNVVEEPGPYAGGVVGPLIPAGARLLLAIAERLLSERGITYAMMDTDGLDAIHPPNMPRDEFRQRVQEVVDWFRPLNVYQEPGSLLAYEDQNCGIDPNEPNAVTSELEPLYCIATSAKRYVEFNVREDAERRLIPILRKFTAHGLGLWPVHRDMTAADLPPSIPAPHTYKEVDGERVPDSAPLGGPLWLYRLQWEFVYTLLNGETPDGRPLHRDADGVPWYFPTPGEWLDIPAYSQFSIETWADYQRVQHLPGLRPGGFITVYPAPSGMVSDTEVSDGLTRVVYTDMVVSPDGDEDISGSNGADGESADDGTTRVHEEVLSRQSRALYSPYATSAAEVARLLASGQIRRVADDAPVPPGTDLKTLYGVVAFYFIHPEAKAANPDGVGELRRRHLHEVGADVIGKESNRIGEAAAQDTADVLGNPERSASYGYGPATADLGTRRRRLSPLFDESMPDLLAASCLSRDSIERASQSARSVSRDTVAALEMATALLDPDHPQSLAGWREVLTTPASLAVLLDAEASEFEVLLRDGGETLLGEHGREVTAAHAAHVVEREQARMEEGIEHEAAKLVEEERAQVVRILRRAGGVRASTDPATGRELNRGEWELLPISVRRRQSGRLTMDQAIGDVLAEMPHLAWETPDDLVRYFERDGIRTRRRASRKGDGTRTMPDAINDAQDRFRGRVTWTPEERLRLVRFMVARRERLAAPEPETPEPITTPRALFRLPDIRDLAGVPFRIITVEWREVGFPAAVLTLWRQDDGRVGEELRVRVADSALLADLLRMGRLDEGRRESSTYVVVRLPKRGRHYQLQRIETTLGVEETKP